MERQSDTRLIDAGSMLRADPGQNIDRPSVIEEPLLQCNSTGRVAGQEVDRLDPTMGCASGLCILGSQGNLVCRFFTVDEGAVQGQ